MKTITLSDLTQDNFDNAANTVISGIKAYNPRLDTREGTVLRDLLVNPEAAIEGVIAGQIDEARKCSSLQLLQEAQDAGEEVDQSDVNAILSNFNITPSAGKTAKGIVKVIVSEQRMSYSIAKGAKFSTTDGVVFTVDEQILAASSSSSIVRGISTNKLYSGAAGYFFLVPVTAEEPGTSGNIVQGTSLTPDSSISSFVMAEAYKDFCGGSDTQQLSDVIKNIPSGLSIRGFVNKSAAEGMLKSEFDDGDHPIVAVSIIGYGNSAQLRDKHNIFGVGVGGRIDLYVRNFTDYYTVTKTLEGKQVKDADGEIITGSYTINVPVGTFPGAYWIKSVADPFNTLTDSDENVLNSLAFTAKRTADISGTEHDFDSDNAEVEAFNTIWQGFDISLTDVPADINADDSDSSNDGWSDARNFKVTAFCLPQAEELQEYVDRDDVKSVSTDVVVRCPILCHVSVSATVVYDPRKPIDETSTKEKIRNYINTLGFNGKITRSEIVQIIKNAGAVSVDMRNDDMLTGSLYDAAGTYHTLSGDSLDISSIEDSKSMLTKDTVVFCSDERSIQLQLISNS